MLRLKLKGPRIVLKGAMADYHPILARAVSRLATNNAQARHELYEHARTILVAQLRSQDPKASDLNIMSEQVALEGAILRVETESPSVRSTSSSALADYVPLQMNHQLNETSEKICLRDYDDERSFFAEPSCRAHGLRGRHGINFSVCSLSPKAKSRASS
jgi:hypothetical protein